MHRSTARTARTARTAHRVLRGTSGTLDTWVPAGRRLVIVDLENLVGGSAASLETVREALAALDVAIGRDTHDVRVVASGSTLLTTAMSLLASTRVSLGRGVDGADRRLLDELDPARVVGRYDSVVLVSADGAAFADRVTVLSRLGVPTDVVVGAGACSRRLAAAARTVRSVYGPQFALAA
jgi:hypothetical protein